MKLGINVLPLEVTFYFLSSVTPTL